MKILFVSAVLPYPLYSGGQIRIYNLLRRLSADHEITLVSFIRDENEREHINHLNFLQSVHLVNRGRAAQMPYLVKALSGSYPWLLATYDNKEMRDTLSQLLRDHLYDLVHLEPFYVWPSVPQTSVPILVSEHNIEYDVYRIYANNGSNILRPLMNWDIQKMQTWEHRIWQMASGVTAVSKEDAQVIKNNTTVPVSIVPNGVDVAQFVFKTTLSQSKKTLLFVGNFRWIANRGAAEKLVRSIWPQVKLNHKDARLIIVGRDMPISLKDEIIASGGIVDESAENISKIYANADILVAPLEISGGSKFKILEAMASGVLVITTKAGASGIEMKPDKHYVEAEQTADFVRRISDCFENQKKVTEITKAARLLIEEQYSWDSIAGDLGDIWKKTIKNK